MPKGPSRDSRELELQTAIGQTAFFYQGESSPDAGKALERAIELAVALEDAPQKALALTLLVYHHTVRMELPRASELSQDLYELAQKERDHVSEFFANHIIGYSPKRWVSFARLSSSWAQQPRTARAYLR